MSSDFNFHSRERANTWPACYSTSTFYSTPIQRISDENQSYLSSSVDPSLFQTNSFFDHGLFSVFDSQNEASVKSFPGIEPDDRRIVKDDNDLSLSSTTSSSPSDNFFLYTSNTRGGLEGRERSEGGNIVQRKTWIRKNAWGNQSYADLITQAIESSVDKRLTLSQIYDWVVKNIDFFKNKTDNVSSAGWKVN